MKCLLTMKYSLTVITAAVSVTAAAAVLAVHSASSAETPTVTDLPKVMTGLYNPRGLAFGPDGALYVAEAGRGCESDETQMMIRSLTTLALAPIGLSPGR